MNSQQTAEQPSAVAAALADYEPQLTIAERHAHAVSVLAELARSVPAEQLADALAALYIRHVNAALYYNQPPNTDRDTYTLEGFSYPLAEQLRLAIPYEQRNKSMWLCEQCNAAERTVQGYRFSRNSRKPYCERIDRQGTRCTGMMNLYSLQAR